MIRVFRYRENLLFPLAAFFSISLFLWRSRPLFLLYTDSRPKTGPQTQMGGDGFPRLPHAPMGTPQEKLHETLSRVAKEAGLKRLLSVAADDAADGGTVQLVWESDQNSSLLFYDLLHARGIIGRSRRLQIAGSESTPGFIHVTADFIPGNPVSHAGLSKKSVVARKIERPVFKPLWSSMVANQSSENAREKKRLELARVEEQRLAEKRRYEQEAEQRLLLKRRQLESELALTGIVNNGREALAFIVRGGGGTHQTLMLHQGEEIADARVVSIDESRGEVQLDYQGKFQVVLRMNPVPAGAVR